MKIKDILQQNQVTLSFEVFPPKKEEGLLATLEAAHKIAALHPDFVSVTYGAAGTAPRFTVEVASDLQSSTGTAVLPHFTCVASTRETVDEMLGALRKHHIENIMALRGDIPQDGSQQKEFLHASDLIRYIRSTEYGQAISIGGACYPEKHPESSSKEEDLQHLKDKIDAGCDFLTTQMFFSNETFYNFLYRVRDRGINVPILAGIMPITSRKQLGRSVQLSGTNVPDSLKAIVDRFGDDPAALKQAGIIYASNQIIDLIANGVTHIHVYSMNKPDVAEGILRNISEILR